MTQRWSHLPHCVWLRPHSYLIRILLQFSLKPVTDLLLYLRNKWYQSLAPRVINNINTNWGTAEAQQNRLMLASAIRLPCSSWTFVLSDKAVEC